MGQTIHPYAINRCPAPATKFAKESGVTMTAAFIPQSVSRNKDSDEMTVNWAITLQKGTFSMSIDYTQLAWDLKGDKHIYERAEKLRHERHLQDKACKVACETGVTEHRHGKALKAFPPTLEDVLYCLTMDADVLDCSGFEEWARRYGHNKGSRAAEKIYQACLGQSLQVKQLIDLEAAEKAFQDYC